MMSKFGLVVEGTRLYQRLWHPDILSHEISDVTLFGTRLNTGIDSTPVPTRLNE